MKVSFDVAKTFVRVDADRVVFVELEITRMHHTNTTFTFTHELRDIADLQKAVLFARHKLMQEAVRLQFNILLSEG